MIYDEEQRNQNKDTKKSSPTFIFLHFELRTNWIIGYDAFSESGKGGIYSICHEYNSKYAFLYWKKNKFSLFSWKYCELNSFMLHFSCLSKYLVRVITIINKVCGIISLFDAIWFNWYDWWQRNLNIWLTSNSCKEIWRN